MHAEPCTCLTACKISITCGVSVMHLLEKLPSSKLNGAGRPGSSAGVGGQRSMTTPEKTLKRMLNKTGLSSDSEAEAGSNEAAEEDDDEDDDEPDLDALATRLSAKVGWHCPKFLSDSGGLNMLHLMTLGWPRCGVRENPPV